MEDIKASLSRDMRAGKAWNQVALSIADKDLTKADLAQHVTRLVEAARRAGNDPSSIREYRAAVESSMRQIERLAKAGAPNTKLKAQYKEVVAISRSGSDEALQRSIDWLTTEKMRYNADRIARTEMAKAYSQGEYMEAQADDQVIGMGYDLSDRHPRPDICDFHTHVDLFGLGPGRYPLSHLPPYPFHPNCMCTIYKVFSGDISAMDSAAAVKYLKSLPLDKRREILGIEGEQEFRRAAGSWKSNLPNFEGYKDIGDLIAAALR
jgi:hypothetical protein